MSVIQQLVSRCTAIIEQAGKVIDSASPAVQNVLKTSAALGVARTGTRVAGSFIRRNPGLMVAAAVVGAGVLAYSSYRKRAAPSTPAQTIEGELVEPAVRRPRKATQKRAKRAAPVAAGDTRDATADATAAKPRSTRKRTAVTKPTEPRAT